MNPSIDGSSVTDTFSPLKRMTGGISLKEAGVEATNSLCSSGEENTGTALIRVTAGITIQSTEVQFF